MKHKGAPLLGDKQYGKKNIKFKKLNKQFEKIFLNISGQALHAKTLGFNHPTKNKFIQFESKLPHNFKKLVDLLEKLAS